MTPPAALRGRAELGLAALVVAAGAFLLVETAQIQTPATTNVVGPRFFPILVGVLLVVVGVWLAVDVLRGGRGDPETGEDTDPDRPTDWRALVWLTGAFAAHVLLLERAGWPVAGAVLFWGCATGLGSRRPALAAAVAVALAVAAYLVFSRLLGVGLPAGVLEGVL